MRALTHLQGLLELDGISVMLEERIMAMQVRFGRGGTVCAFGY